MQFKLDDLDRHLLSLLQSNARESTAMLARKLKIARTTVVARIARLEREGVIAGYGIRIGQKLEHAVVRAVCGLGVNAKNAPVIMKALAFFPEVEEIFAVSGQYDYIVFLCCSNNEQLDNILDRLGQMEGINQTHTSIVLSRKLDRRSDISKTEESTNARFTHP
jgi:DNA-binding Lrp family transcriptional regulator